MLQKKVQLSPEKYRYLERNERKVIMAKDIQLKEKQDKCRYGDRTTRV